VLVASLCLETGDAMACAIARVIEGGMDRTISLESHVVRLGRALRLRRNRARDLALQKRNEAVVRQVCAFVVVVVQ
jgi:hypothetical protein